MASCWSPWPAMAATHRQAVHLHAIQSLNYRSEPATYADLCAEASRGELAAAAAAAACLQLTGAGEALTAEPRACHMAANSLMA